MPVPSSSPSDTVLAMVTAMLDEDEALAFGLLSERMAEPVGEGEAHPLAAVTWSLLAMVVRLVRDSAERAERDPLELWSSLVLAERVRRGDW